MALALAEQVGGVIVNADSAQIYRELPILSAAPGPDELSRAEHRLYGVLDGAQPCSAADWAEMAKHAIAEVHASGSLPILVGGTGLYIRTLLQGIAPVPTIDPDVRRKVRERSVEENRLDLLALDAEAAERLKPADRLRIARALEVVLSTGKRLREWQQRREGGIAEKIRLRPVLLLPPREWLYRRCDELFAAMIHNGAAEEVRALLNRHLDPNLPVMRGIGVHEIEGWLNGRTTREEAVAAGQQATRRYAKRQYTWFAHQPPAEWPRFREALDDRTLPQALALLQATS